MDNNLLKSTINLLEEYEEQANKAGLNPEVQGFKDWIVKEEMKRDAPQEYSVINWENKEKGRTAESVISTLFVKMNRFVKSYTKPILMNSKFSTMDDVIFLNNLKVFGEMSKMDLIQRNIHDKPTGMQIIKRLIDNGWVQQSDSAEDKRKKIIKITSKGKEALENKMDEIRKVSNIVRGNLTYIEKMELIKLLTKLYEFHHSIYKENIDSSDIIDKVYKEYLIYNN